MQPSSASLGRGFPTTAMFSSTLPSEATLLLLHAFAGTQNGHLLIPSALLACLCFPQSLDCPRQLSLSLRPPRPGVGTLSFVRSPVPLSAVVLSECMVLGLASAGLTFTSYCLACWSRANEALTAIILPTPFMHTVPRLSFFPANRLNLFSKVLYSPSNLYMPIFSLPSGFIISHLFYCSVCIFMMLILYKVQVVNFNIFKFLY